MVTDLCKELFNEQLDHQQRMDEAMFNEHILQRNFKFEKKK